MRRDPTRSVISRRNRAGARLQTGSSGGGRVTWVQCGCWRGSRCDSAGDASSSSRCWSGLLVPLFFRASPVRVVHRPLSRGSMRRAAPRHLSCSWGTRRRGSCASSDMSRMSSRSRLCAEARSCFRRPRAYKRLPRPWTLVSARSWIVHALSLGGSPVPRPSTRRTLVRPSQHSSTSLLEIISTASRTPPRKWTSA